MWRVEPVKQYYLDFVGLLELVDFDGKLGYQGDLGVAVVDSNAQLPVAVVVADYVAYGVDVASYAEAHHLCCHRMVPFRTLLAGNRTSFAGHGGDASRIRNAEYRAPVGS